MRIEALGPLSVTATEGPVRLRPAHRRLLASLLLDAGREVSADRLIDRLWGDRMPATARNTLQAHISALRHRAPGLIRSTPGGYIVDLTLHEFDVAEFTGLVADSSAHLAAADMSGAEELARHAVELWRDDPYLELDGVDAASAERRRLHELYLSANGTLGAALLGQGRMIEVIAALEKLTSVFSLHEPFWEQLVEAYTLAGRQVDALRAYGKAARILGEEIGVDPGPRLRELEARALRHDPALAVHRSLPVGNNLPFYDTSFIGRESDVAAVLNLVELHPVVTVTGGPGMGKTRLAVEVGRRALSRFPGGVWVARLEGAAADTDVSATIASATVTINNVEGLEQLRSHLASRPCLLILDNCDRIISSVRRFLGEVPLPGPMRVLATSRSILGLTQEWVWRVGPLELPVGQAEPSGSPAVQLFADRAAAVDPEFRLGPSNSAAVVDVCMRSGGIPLAIELAATWEPYVSLSDVVGLALEPRVGSMGGDDGSKASLAKTIDRSVEVLTQEEQHVFDTASVFSGTFDLDALHAVCLPASTHQDAAVSAARLVDVSLLATEHTIDGRVRYRMLEPLREYGWRRLVAAERGDSTSQLHAGCYLERAGLVQDLATGPGEAASLADLDSEIPDYRKAMRYFLDTGHPEEAARISIALSRYWSARYLAWEALRWLDEALDGEMGNEVRISAYLAAGWTAYLGASYEVAEGHYSRCLELAATIGDRLAEARALYGLARIHLPRRLRDGEPLLRQALATFVTEGAEVEAAECRLWIGLRAANAGDAATAYSSLKEALETLERHGYMVLVSIAYRYLSMTAWYEGNERSSRFFLDRAENVAQATGDHRAIAGALIQRGLVEGKWGEPAAAAEAILKALEPIPRTNDIDHCLVLFGALPTLIAERRWVMASQLLAHCDRIFDEYGWLPVDSRIPAAAEYRATIDKALEGRSIEHPSVASAEIADELTAVLSEISRATANRSSDRATPTPAL